uniref:SfiI-subtelomeric related protein family member, putative n=1 Tax=Theileria annulata TaxID=5874 RepID=A0A3B0MZK6_THEAN
MKKCIISLNILYYITFLHRFNGVESQPASLSTGQSTPETVAVDSGSTTPVTTTITPITLDINKSKDTNEFYFKKDGNFRTYTPKDSNVFNKVVKKSLEIWSAEPDDHGLKAVLMGSKNEPKYLGILLQSGNYVILHKSGKNKPWNDITSKTFDITKLGFLGDNDTELTSSDYDVSLVDLLFTYTFNDGINCRKVKLGDNEVWKHSDDSKFAEIKSFSLGLASNSFFVKNQSGETKKLDFKPTQSTTPTPPQATTPGTSTTPQGTGSGSGTPTPQTPQGTPPPSTGTSGSVTTPTSGSVTTPTSGTGTQPSRRTEESAQNSTEPTSYDKLLSQNLQNLNQKSTKSEQESTQQQVTTNQT